MTTLIPEAWWDRFEAPEGMQAEIIQGQLVLSPPPTKQHALVVARLMKTLGAAAPLDCVAVTGLEWRVANGMTVVSALVPDVLVVPEAGDTVEPILAVEVISLPDRLYLVDGRTRIEGKRDRYAAQGLAHYLEVNLLARTISRYCRANCDLNPVELGRMAVEVNQPFPYRLMVSELLGD